MLRKLGIGEIMQQVYDTKNPIINFSDILYVYKIYEGQVLHHEVRNHTLAYVYSGQLEVSYKGRVMMVEPGECVFLARNNRVQFRAFPKDGVELKSAFLTLTRQFLVRYYHQLDHSLLPPPDTKRIPALMMLPKENLAVGSLFKALTSFFMAWQMPTRQYMELKECEAAEGLMNINPRFCVNLFDFVGPWKVDIMEFLEENFREELSLDDLALYTGRSLASFKRDFAAISPLSPQRWLTRRRLQEAHRLMQQGRKPSEFYQQLGFKSLSHFSTAFRREYGKSPSELFDKPQ